MKRSAFTLIELLVVIAIIAILAAILFPVFAQAKLAAKKTQALAHAKQIGTAAHIYATDYDDFFPSVYDGGEYGGNPQGVLIPYIKNWNIWYVNREDSSGPSSDRADFGYNWGYEIRSAEAMVSEEICTTGAPVTSCSGNRVNRGKSITQMVNPADLFAFGDSYDTWRMTMGGDGWQLDTFPTGTVFRNSRLRYGGKLVMVYADSHAKTVAFKGGAVSWGRKGRITSPKSLEQRINGYCADPDATMRPFPRSGYPLGSMTCRQFVSIPEASGVVWWND